MMILLIALQILKTEKLTFCLKSIIDIIIDSMWNLLSKPSKAEENRAFEIFKLLKNPTMEDASKEKNVPSRYSFSRIFTTTFFFNL